MSDENEKEVILFIKIYGKCDVFSFLYDCSFLYKLAGESVSTFTAVHSFPLLTFNSNYCNLIS